MNDIYENFPSYIGGWRKHNEKKIDLIELAKPFIISTLSIMAGLTVLWAFAVIITLI